MAELLVKELLDLVVDKVLLEHRVVLLSKKSTDSFNIE
jgi:hypothetical protein